MKRILISLSILFTFLSAQATHPVKFRVPNVNYSKTTAAADTSQPGLLSNVVSEIRLQGDTSWVWLGTGRGFSRVKDSLNIETFFTSSNLTNGSNTGGFFPEGGVSAIAVRNDTVFAAFASSENDFPIGKGVVYTSNSTVENPVWTYYDQPIDFVDAETFPWGGIGFIQGLPITVAQYNVSYDASIGKGYVWITSWAGGLRRYTISDGSWERVPVPQDDQLMLITCADSSYEMIDGKKILKNFFMNPRDPIDGGNHNHKAFSVLSYSDTIWVGTANGINRGILGSGNCIDWKHYSYPMDNLSGNFVVGLEIQRLNGKRIIWAATVNADDPTEKRGLSYTIDDGLSWNTALLGERIYNIAAFDSLVFAASANGLWKTEDGINWALYKPAHQAIPIPNTAIYDLDEVLADEVYSVAFDNRSYYGDRSIWIGTGDGAAHSYDLDGLSWKIFRAEYDINEDYAYPNPFSPYTHNVLNDNGYVRFHTNEWSGTFVIDIDIQVTKQDFLLQKIQKLFFFRRPLEDVS